jgi:hypothetical protein
MYRITIETVGSDLSVKPPEGCSYPEASQKLYEQTVEAIYLPKIIQAINAKHRKPRAPKVKP